MPRQARLTAGPRGRAGLKVEKWFVHTEGRCGAVVTRRCPATPNSTVVVTADGHYDGTPSAVVTALTARLSADGACVAVVNLCGFGEVGQAFVPNMYDDGKPKSSLDRKNVGTESWARQLVGGEEPPEARSPALDGEQPSALALWTGRSLVGRHASGPPAAPAKQGSWPSARSTRMSIPTGPKTGVSAIASVASAGLRAR